MISQEIVGELISLFNAIIMGVKFAFIYDCIRIFRRVVVHRKVWMMCLEDILYWMVIAFEILLYLYQKEDRIFRGFMIVGYLIGAVSFELAISKIYIKYATRLIKFLIFPLLSVKNRLVKLKNKSSIKE